MHNIVRYIYILYNKKNIDNGNRNRNNQLNKYCNCKSIKYYKEDMDAYGEWILCTKCDAWCGWYYNQQYYNKEGVHL